MYEQDQKDEFLRSKITTKAANHCLLAMAGWVGYDGPAVFWAFCFSVE
jgi:hypothetical protein